MSRTFIDISGSLAIQWFTGSSSPIHAPDPTRPDHKQRGASSFIHISAFTVANSCNLRPTAARCRHCAMGEIAFACNCFSALLPFCLLHFISLSPLLTAFCLLHCCCSLFVVVSLPTFPLQTIGRGWATPTNKRSEKQLEKRHVLSSYA